MSEKIHCRSLDDLNRIAGRLIEKYPESRIFAIYGVMGAGKTTFIRSLGNQLQVKDVVNSPTFAIINEYACADEKRIFHFDLYRIKSIRELQELGYEDYFFSGHYCFIEWPELIEEYLPGETIRVKIELPDEKEGRIFTF